MCRTHTYKYKVCRALSDVRNSRTLSDRTLHPASTVMGKGKRRQQKKVSYRRMVFICMLIGTSVELQSTDPLWKTTVKLT